MYSLRTLITTTNVSGGQEKRLSIGLNGNGFSFSETTADGYLLSFGEAEGEHASAMTQTTRDLKMLFAEAGIRPLGYNAMELILTTDANVWVPDELYSMPANRQYMKLLGAEARQVMTCHSDELRSTAIFTGDDQTATAFKVALPGLTIINQHVKAATLAPQSREHPILFTQWRAKKIDIDVFRNGRYLYSNSIDYIDREEGAFRVVEVMKVFGIETDNTEVLLCGEVDRELFNIMRPYFPQTTLYSGRANKYMNPEFKRLHTYRYATILM